MTKNEVNKNLKIYDFVFKHTYFYKSIIKRDRKECQTIWKI
jgi:hypothetical protein